MATPFSITARALIETITMQPSGMNTGRIRSMLHTAKGVQSGNRRPMAANVAPQPVVKYLSDLLRVMETAERTSVPQHPIDVARPRHADRDTGKPDPLSASDIAWISGLPSDPEQVSWNDAVDLASMALAFTGSNGRNGDARLIRQRWEPISEVYDRRVSTAQAAAANATLPAIPVPAEAVAELLAYELPPEMRPSEIRARANELVDAAFEKRKAQHERRIAAAKAAAEAIEQRSLNRRSTAPQGQQ